MKITTTESTQVEQEITLPYYSKGAVYAYAVLSDTKAIELEHLGEMCIEILSPTHAFRAGETECTRSEFDTILKSVQAKIRNAISEYRQPTESSLAVKDIISGNGKDVNDQINDYIESRP